MLSSSLRALQWRSPSRAQGAPLPPSAIGPSLPLPLPLPRLPLPLRPLPRSGSGESHALAPARGLGPAREPLVANHRAVERRALGSGAPGEPAGAAGPGRLRRSPRHRQTHRVAGGRARTECPGRLRSEARASPGPGRPRPAPRSRRRRRASPSAGGRCAGGRSREAPARPARDVSGGGGGSHLAPHLERRAPGRRGECAPPAAAAPAPDHGVRPPARVRPPRRPLGPALGARGTRARGPGRCPARGAQTAGGRDASPAAPLTRGVTFSLTGAPAVLPLLCVGRLSLSR